MTSQYVSETRKAVVSGFADLLLGFPSSAAGTTGACIPRVDESCPKTFALAYPRKGMLETLRLRHCPICTKPMIPRR
jgi:hypothetical protein